MTFRSIQLNNGKVLEGEKARRCQEQQKAG